MGRWLNADGFLATGLSSISHNMYAYCGNNPVNRIDMAGMFWKEIESFFSNVWNGFKDWVSSTFGASSSTTTTISEVRPMHIADKG